MEWVKTLFCCCCPAYKRLQQTERAHIQGGAVYRRNGYVSEHRQQCQRSPESERSFDSVRLVKSLECTGSASFYADQRADFKTSGSQQLPTKQEHKRSHLHCFIVPSFGKDPPDNVAVKKMAGDFLRGVGDDFEIIKQLIKNDSCKHLYDVEIMSYFAQKKPSDFTKIIEDAMIDLKMKHKGCKFKWLFVAILGCTHC